MLFLSYFWAESKLDIKEPNLFLLEEKHIRISKWKRENLYDIESVHYLLSNKWIDRAQ